MKIVRYIVFVGMAMLLCPPEWVIGQTNTDVEGFDSNQLERFRNMRRFDYPDPGTGTGEQVETYEREDGTVVKRYPDGSVVEKHPDGSETRRLPDGTVIKKNPDGTTEKTSSGQGDGDLMTDEQRDKRGEGAERGEKKEEKPVKFNMSIPEWVIYLVGFLIIGVIAYFIIKGYQKKPQDEQLEEKDDSHGEDDFVENIHEIDFDSMINQLIAKGDYRQVVRILYLQSLKNLTDKGLIKWDIDKTNQDYLTELRGKSNHQEFRYLTTVFEYVWYGKMQLKHTQFEHIKVQFYKFDDNVMK